MPVKMPSGRFVVRIPPELHARLKEQAHREAKSLNDICLRRLSVETARADSGTSRSIAHDAVASHILGEIRREFSRRLVGIVLFGSAARGDATEGSDIDLLLALSAGTPLTRELYRRWDRMAGPPRGEHIPPNLSPQFAVVPRDVADAGGLWYEVALEGIVLWENDGIVSAALRSIRTGMADGRLRRATVHGSPYWVRNFERGTGAQ